MYIAEATGDADLLITGHGLACTCYYWAGELIKVLEHADKVLDLYDAEKHRHLADILYQDPKTLAGIFPDSAYERDALIVSVVSHPALPGLERP